MVVKLYKLDASPPARAAMIGCELFNVPVEMIDVKLFSGEHLKPDYLKYLPTLEDGDVVVHDSNAILMYLADVYGKQDSLYPKDPKQRVSVNQKLFFNGIILFPRLRNITYPLLVEGSKDVPQKGLDAIEEAYGFIEEFLSRTKYLAGNNITIADVAAFTSVTALQVLLELNVKKYPKTQAWLKELENLPYIQKHHPAGHEGLIQLIKSKLAG